MSDLKRPKRGQTIFPDMNVENAFEFLSVLNHSFAIIIGSDEEENCK